MQALQYGHWMGIYGWTSQFPPGQISCLRIHRIIIKSIELILVISIYFLQGLILGPFSTFINGFGKLKLGIYVITLKLIVFIPLAFYLGENYGAIGIVSSMIIAQLPSMISEPLQVYKILNKSAKGIWNL